VSPFGNASRNPGRTPKFYETDFDLNKQFNTPVDGLKIQFRAEIYNIFNHTNLYLPASGLGGTLSTATSINNQQPAARSPAHSSPHHPVRPQGPLLANSVSLWKHPARPACGCFFASHVTDLSFSAAYNYQPQGQLWIGLRFKRRKVLEPRALRRNPL